MMFSILILSYVNSFAQTDNINIEKMSISHFGDSLIPQGYELDVKSKRVYFKTPYANYLHIKGEKYRRRVKIDKKKRKEIFKCVDQLNLTNLGQTKYSDNKYSFYIIEIFFTNHTNNKYTIPDEKLPKDFRKLYDTIIEN